MEQNVDLSRFITTENLENDPEFIEWTLTLLRALQQMKIEGAISGNDPLIKLMGNEDGVDIDYILKSIEDQTTDGIKWLKQIADTTQLELLMRQL